MEDKPQNIFLFYSRKFLLYKIDLKTNQFYSLNQSYILASYAEF